MFRLPWLALLLVLLQASTAGADKLLFSGEHGIRFSNFGGFEVVATGTGVANVNGGAGGPQLDTLELTRPFAQITTTVPVTTALASQVPEIQLNGIQINPALQGGVFAPIFGAAQNTTLQLTQNTLPVAGTIRLCQVVGCGTAITQPLTQTTGTGGMAIGAGVGGTFTVGTGGTTVMVVGQPWTIKTVTVSQRTASGGISTLMGTGFVHGPASNTGSTAATMGSGVIQLVSAIQTTSTGVPGNNDLSGQISRLTLHFTPEPGLLLLLVAGAGAVTLLGRRRIRR